MQKPPDSSLRTKLNGNSQPVVNDLQKEAENALNAGSPNNTNFTVDIWLTHTEPATLTAVVKDVALRPEKSTDSSNPGNEGALGNTDRLVILALTQKRKSPINLKLGEILTYNFPQLMGENGIPEFVQNVDVWLQSAFALWTKPLPGGSQSNIGESRYVIGMDLAIDTGIRLPATPIPGKPTPNEQKSLVTVVRLMYSSNPFKFYEISGINKELPQGLDGLAISRKKPDTDIDFGTQQDAIILQKGPYFSVHIDSNLSNMYESLRAGTLESDGYLSPDYIGDYTVKSERTIWAKIEKTFGGGSWGGFYIQKLGFQWPDLEKNEKEIGVLFNGGVSLKLVGGEFKISFDQLTLHVPLESDTTSFTLRGFGITGKFMNDVIEASAAFTTHEYTGNEKYKMYTGYGKLKLQLDKFAPSIASKIGSKFELDLLGAIVPEYKDHATAIMLFGFLGLDGKAKFGPFTLEGVALGLGINFLFVPPPIDKLTHVPFIKMALANVKPWNSQNYEDAVASLAAAIPDYLKPADNEYFGCFGLKFMLYGTIDCFALAVFEGGSADSFCMTIMGLMSAKFPNPTPGESNVFQIASISANMMMVLDMGKGFFQLQTQLSPTSFLFDGACRLTGGLALYSWFGNSPYAGDWVFTIGGYHSQFQVPAHYPRVPRLGYSWSLLSGYVVIKGEAYFAICAHAFMLGGRLEIRGTFGPARAWLTAALDAIVCWKPLHYEISIEVSVGVGLGSLTASLGATLHLWGPAFGGAAEVRIKIIFVTIKVHISFGASASQGIPAISWNSFKTSFLPQAEQICTLQISSGRVKVFDNAANIVDPEAPDAKNLPLFFINAKEFECVAQTSVPINALSWNDSNGSLSVSTESLKVAVAPVGVNSNNLDSILTVNAYKKSTEVLDQSNYTWEHSDDFAWALTLEPSSPAALWAEPDFANQSKLLLNPPKVNGTRFVNDLINGVRVFPAKEPQPGETQNIQTSLLLQNYYPQNSAYAWNQIPVFHPSAQSDSDREKQIEQTIETNHLRDEILTILGFQLQDITVQHQTLDQFLAVPQVCA